MPKHSVAFRLLGPVDVFIDGSGLMINSPRQRALLAQLLLDANRTLSATSLIEGIWGSAPPQHPESALHIVVCRLRRALDVLASRLVRDRSGYRIEVDSHELDLSVVRIQYAEAMHAMQDGEMDRAAESFDAALESWRGEALADVSSFPFHEPASRRLRELQLEIVEQRNEAYMRCGRHVEVLKDIDGWIGMEPWRERLRGHQMMALYAAGRQIEALAAYEDLRRLLVREFGVDPSNDLQRLHGAILRQDRELLATLEEVQTLYGMTLCESPNGQRAGGDTVESLVGRLREVVGDRNVMVVEGGPGVSKTWLVVEVEGAVPGHTSGVGSDPTTIGPSTIGGVPHRTSLVEVVERMHDWVPGLGLGPVEVSASPNGAGEPR